MKENSVDGDRNQSIFSPSDEVVSLELFERNTCLRCLQHGGALLICSQSDCPVSFHFNCLDCKPFFDPSGNFFCPYCSFKQRKTKEKIVNAKKKKNQTTLEPVQENLNELEVSDSRQVKDNDNDNDNDKDKGKVFISISSTRETETIDPESNFISVEKDKGKRKFDAAGGGGGGGVDNGEEPSSGELKIGKQNVDQNLHIEKRGRRKVFWTAQEEEKLKEGVSKFSTENDDYIPWQEILEWGSNVFHKTRSKDNLKDKWKRMKGGKKNTS